jgi:diguanylate cyclase (GGDEF)-like protein
MSEASVTDRRRHLEEISIFHDVAKALTSSLNLDSVLQTIMEKMAQFFRPDTWSLLMVDDQKDELYFAIAVGDAAETLKSIRLKIGEGIAGWVAKNGESLIVPDVLNDARFAKRIDEMTKWQTRSIICIPLKSKHNVLGVIQLINCALENFSDNEMFFLHALCDYAAIAIDNARAVERIQELTITDDCTGLYNARHLYKTLESEVYRSQRFGYEFSVIFIDLDHFKQVNDTYGHLAGDAVLREAARRMQNSIRQYDSIGRYGGEEFLILFPGCSATDTYAQADRLRKQLGQAEMSVNDQSLRITASFGVTSAMPGETWTEEALIRKADEALYVAKKSGRNRVEILTYQSEPASVNSSTETVVVP